MIEQDDKKNIEDTYKGIFLSNRHASFVVSGALFFSFVVFMSGYFLGQKNAVERFANKVEQESFADQLYSSMCMMHENKDNELNESEEPVVSSAVVAQGEKLRVQAESSEKIVEGPKQNEQYYAQLIGFGAEKTAQQFAQRLHKKHIDVIVKKRISKTSKGKTICWYQVVTQKFMNKDALNVLVDTISDQERLKGVRIVTC